MDQDNGHFSVKDVAILFRGAPKMNALQASIIKDLAELHNPFILISYLSYFTNTRMYHLQLFDISSPIRGICLYAHAKISFKKLISTINIIINV